MDEALKTRIKRGSDFYVKYLSGKVIDIGAGEDLVTPDAERFDIEDGDANFITRYRSTESYDAVHSSHCLEHMFNPKEALKEWWSLIKPGGHLVLVVPDEDLYEQGIWPSVFNTDHKNTFRLNGNRSWSPVSYNIKELVSSLPNSVIISADLHDDYYDYSLKTEYPPKIYKVNYFTLLALKIFRRVPYFGKKVTATIENLLYKYSNFPIDQTMRNALAQIQVVATKSVS